MSWSWTTGINFYLIVDEKEKEYFSPFAFQEEFPNEISSNFNLKIKPFFTII